MKVVPQETKSYKSIHKNRNSSSKPLARNYRNRRVNPKQIKDVPFKKAATSKKKMIICFSLLLALILIGGGAAAGIATFVLTGTETADSTTSSTTVTMTTATTATTTTSVTTTTSTTSSTTTTTTSTSSTTTSTTTTTTTTSTTTTSTSTTTTTALPIHWNLTSTTVAGVTAVVGSTANKLALPYGLAIDSMNSIYIADRWNHRIQKWTFGASIGMTVAGNSNGTLGSTLSSLNQPCEVILDQNNNLYVSDTENHRVLLWLVNATVGTIVAGTGTSGTSLNQLNRPHGLARDSSTGTLYIADYNNNRVMKYLPGATSGTIVAGGNGNGLSNTQLSGPLGISLDSTTNSIIIANNDAHNVVRWPIGASSWTLIAGSNNGTSGNMSNLLCNPTYVKLDSMYNMYVGDRCNHRIIHIPYGQTNYTTIAGVTGTRGNSSVLLFNPSVAIIDSQFNIYVADNDNQRIQKFNHYY